MATDAISTDYARRLDVTILRGMTTEALGFLFVDGAEVPLDVTAWSAQLQVFDASGAVIYTLTTTNGKLLNQGATGIISINYDAAGTWALAPTATPTPLTYELVVTLPTGRHLSHYGAYTISTPKTSYP